MTTEYPFARSIYFRSLKKGEQKSKCCKICEERCINSSLYLSIPLSLSSQSPQRKKTHLTIYGHSQLVCMCAPGATAEEIGWKKEEETKEKSTA